MKAAVDVPWGTRHGKRVNGRVGSPCASTGNPPVCFHGEPTWGTHLGNPPGESTWGAHLPECEPTWGTKCGTPRVPWYIIAVKVNQIETHTPFPPLIYFVHGQGFNLGFSLYNGLSARHRNRIPGGSTD